MNGIVYTKRNRAGLDLLVISEDWSSLETSCISGATDLSVMFSSASSFNGDISAWDVSSVTNMYGMFYNASSFNQDLSGWCVSNITALPTDFDTDATSWVLDRPVWGTCP